MFRKMFASVAAIAVVVGASGERVCVAAAAVAEMFTGREAVLAACKCLDCHDNPAKH